MCGPRGGGQARGGGGSSGAPAHAARLHAPVRHRMHGRRVRPARTAGPSVCERAVQCQCRLRAECTMCLCYDTEAAHIPTSRIRAAQAPTKGQRSAAGAHQRAGASRSMQIDSVSLNALRSELQSTIVVGLRHVRHHFDTAAMIMWQCVACAEGATRWHSHRTSADTCARPHAKPCVAHMIGSFL